MKLAREVIGAGFRVYSFTETMPTTDACQFFYECKGCGTLLKPNPGDCCVFCSFGTEIYNQSYHYRHGLPVIMILLFTGCAHVPDITPRPPAQSKIPPVVNYALSLQGTPYRYGKESPQEGFDCSGFVQHVYKHHGISLPRTSREMARTLPPISKNNLFPGDLVFFNTDGHPFSHVGLYVENDTFVHAPSRHTGKVLVSSLSNRYWRSRFTAARRPR
jgi:hypothetical protein